MFYSVGHNVCYSHNLHTSSTSIARRGRHASEACYLSSHCSTLGPHGALTTSAAPPTTSLSPSEPQLPKVRLPRFDLWEWKDNTAFHYIREIKLMLVSQLLLQPTVHTIRCHSVSDFISLYIYWWDLYYKFISLYKKDLLNFAAEVSVKSVWCAVTWEMISHLLYD